MKTLLCPKCGYGVDKHGDSPGLGFYDSEASTMGVFYPCPLSKVDMLLAAQRAAAFTYLKRLGRSYLYCRNHLPGVALQIHCRIVDSIAAYRAIGFLNSPKEG